MKLNREIKFRAFISDDKKIYDVLSVSSKFNDEDFNRVFINKPQIDGEVKNYRIECDNKLLQFTGLKDKNGIDIYEGDIIKRSLSGASPTTTDKVYFYKGRFVIGEGDYIKPIADFCTLEVIGNIYENPELLK